MIQSLETFCLSCIYSLVCTIHIKGCLKFIISDHSFFVLFTKKIDHSLKNCTAIGFKPPKLSQHNKEYKITSRRCLDMFKPILVI